MTPVPDIRNSLVPADESTNKESCWRGLSGPGSRRENQAAPDRFAEASHEQIIHPVYFYRSFFLFSRQAARAMAGAELICRAAAGLRATATGLLHGAVFRLER